MATWALQFTEGLWRNAVALVPLVLVVAAVCRVLPCRPATRHAMWLFVLLWMVVPPFAPSFQPVFSDEAQPHPESVIRDTPIDQSPPDVASSQSPSEVHLVALSHIKPSRHVAQANDCVAAPELNPSNNCAQTAPDQACSNPTPTPPWTVDLALIRAPKRLASATDRVGSLSALGLIWLRDALVALVDDFDRRVGLARSEHVNEKRCCTPRNQSEPIEVAPLCVKYNLPDSDACPAVTAPCETETPQQLPGLRVRSGSSPEPCAAIKESVDAQLIPSLAGTELVTVDNPACGSPAGDDEHILREAGVFEPSAISHGPIDNGAAHIDRPSRRLQDWIAASIHPWIVGLVEVRDTIGRLPSIPIGVWLSGVILLISCRIYRVWSVRAHFRRAVPAGREIVKMVDRCARRIGLAGPPDTLMTADRVSPMVWCGLRGRLILPIELWDQLDDLGREAVVLHELAHLKRRDHWVLWTENFIGCLYWWHPVVWWVRRRLREEAENCCDAWVTWLLPKGRRAYAEALLVTRQYVSDSEPTSAVGIGVISGRARRFARRLTMVMTQRSTPGISVSGIALALAVGVAGWLSTPAQSNDKVVVAGTAVAVTTPVPLEVPASPSANVTAASTTCAPAAPTPPSASQPPLPPSPPALAFPGALPALPATPAPPAPACEPIAATTPYAHAVTLAPSAAFSPVPATAPFTTSAWVVPSVQGPPDHGRQQSLEARLERLERMLERLESRLGGSSANGGIHQFPAIVQKGTPVPARERTALAPATGEILSERYKLSPDKLARLVKLMVRDDVPIRVRPGDGFIEVQGTKEQQAIFRAFVEMIDSGDESQSYRLSKGKLKDLSELMVLNDVPVMVRPGEEEIGVQGNGAVQAIFRAFVEMIEPNTDVVSDARGIDLDKKLKMEMEGQHHKLAGKIKGAQSRAWATADAHRAMQDAEKVRRQAMEEVARELKKSQVSHQEAMTKAALEREKAMQKAAEALKGYRIHASKEAPKQLREKIRDAAREAERLEREAERLEKEADSLRDKADSLRSKAESSSDQSRVASLEAEASQLEASASQIEAGMESLFAQAEQFESIASELESMAEEIEASVEAGEEVEVDVDVDIDDEDDADDADDSDDSDSEEE